MMLIPRCWAMPGTGDLNLLALQGDLPRILAVDAAQDLHQGGFSGPVFAHQRVHLSIAELKPRVAQCLDAGEGFVDALHAE